MSTLEFTLLGCGSSGGVPRADGDWGACDPANPKNLRSRCSLLVRRAGQGPEASTTLIVDTSPDLRLQTAQAGAKRLDAILLTHHTVDALNGRSPELIDRGSHALKGKSAAVQVFGLDPSAASGR